jgi:hypothetical protein
MDANKPSVAMQNGIIALALNDNASPPANDPAEVSVSEISGRGLEIILEVDDMQGQYPM